MDRLDLLAVQGTLKSLLQHHSSKASILQCSAFFIVQLSYQYMTTAKTIALTRQSFVGKVMSLLFFFNLRLITLQYCIGFAIHHHESTTGVHLFPILKPPPSMYHPSGSSQCTSPKHPVSCIRPGLAIHSIYDIIHVSMPFSQINPPSPYPTESK